MSGSSPRGYYELLGVDSGADAGTIREAYRERVKETHPDVSDAPDATARFRRVKRAHEVLTDPVERRRYDRLGHEAYVAGGEPVARTAGENEGAAGTSDRETETATDPETDATADRGTGTARDHGGPSHTGSRASAGRRNRTQSTASTGSYRHARARGRTPHGDPAQDSGSEPEPGTESGAGFEGTVAGATDRRDVGAVRWWTARWVRFTGGLVTAWQSRLTPAAGAITMGVFVAYPVLLVSSVGPWFPTSVNLAVGVCTLSLVGYLVARPAIGLPVFGGWTLLFPVALTLGGVGVLSVTGVLVVGLTLLPLAVCLTLLAAGMPV